MQQFRSLSLALGLAALSTGSVVYAQDFASETSFAPTGARTLVAGKIYQVVSRYSGQCLDVRDHSFANGGGLQQWNCTGKSNQQFKLVDAYKNAFNLVAQESGKAVRLEVENDLDGTAIVQSSEYPGNVARFYLRQQNNGSYEIVSTHSGKCLDIDGPSFAAGQRAQQWHCQGSANQQWDLVEQTNGKGATSWDQRNTGLQVDGRGRLFLQSSDGSISLIRKEDAREQWRHNSNGSYPLAEFSCADDRLYLTGSGFLKALKVSDGSQAWKKDLPGDSNYYTCPKGWDQLLAMSGNSNTTVRSFDKASGQERWSANRGDYLSFLSKDGDNIYFTQPNGSRSRIIALKASNGQERWRRDLQDGEYSFVDLKGRLFIRSKNGIERADWNGGWASWTYAAPLSEYVAIDFGSDGSLSFRKGLTQQKVNVDNGSIQWTSRFDGLGDASYVTSLVLGNGDVVQWAVDSRNNQTVVRKLRSGDGGTAWTRQIQQSDAYPFLTKSGQLLLKVGASLQLLNDSNGSTQWTFRREFATANEIFFAFDIYGQDLYLTYGAVSGRYPPMGLIRLDAKTGALQWDRYLNETIYLHHADDQNVYASGPMGSHVAAYKR